MLPDDVEEAMETTLGKQSEFWMGLMSAVGAKANTSIEELHRLDVFDFFALLSVIDKQTEKK